MKNKMMKRVLCGIVAYLFFLNDISYALSPIPGSRNPATQADMHAVGQKLFGAKIGPGSINFDTYAAGSFKGEAPVVPKVKFVASGEKLPPKWQNNPLLQEKDLVRALRYFRDNRTYLKNLDIEEGYFTVKDGELPIAQIVMVKNEDGRLIYKLIVHTKFVQMWNHIRENDVWFEYTFPDGQKRVISVAWGIFYRLAKHEMTDVKKGTDEVKSFGHLVDIVTEIRHADDMGINIMNPEHEEELSATLLGPFYYEKDEVISNLIRGRYNIINDAVWMWFLGSYSFGNPTRYDNSLLSRRVKWFFEDNNLGLKREFPNLIGKEDERSFAQALACAINYQFFGTRRGIEVPKLKVDQTFIDTWKEIEPKIVRTLPATGETPERPAESAPA